MSTPTYLFIGGPADGTWRDVAVAHNFVYVAVLQQPATICEANRFPPKSVIFDKIAYRREKMTTPDGTFTVYCYNDLSVEEMFGLLLKNYKGN